MMTIYYRDDTVLVTSSAIEVDGRRFALDRLALVWHRRTGALARGGRMVAARFGVLVAAVVVVAGVILAFVRLDVGPYTWHVLTGAGLVVLALVGLAGFGVDPLLELLDRSHEYGQGIHESWARIDGREVRLFSTPDAFRFGKIYRALQRAVEASSAPGGDRPDRRDSR